MVAVSLTTGHVFTAPKHGNPYHKKMGEKFS